MSTRKPDDAELAGPAPTITGVTTGRAAFVDFFARGPLDEDDPTRATAVRVGAFREFESVFGGLDPRSEASYGVLQFFRNGGEVAWLVRTGDGSARRARVGVPIGPRDEGPILEVLALDPGAWGNRLRVTWISRPGGRFDLVVREIAEVGGSSQVLASELHTDLALENEQAARFAPTIVEGDSRLIRLQLAGVAAGPGLEPTTRHLGVDPESLSDGDFAALTGGGDGDPPDAMTLIQAMKSALDPLPADAFDLLCLPITSGYGDSEALFANDGALEYCRKRRAFFLVDIPPSVDDAPAVETWSASYRNADNSCAALYFPRLLVPDPLDGFQPRDSPTSGTVAGVMARIDAARGVWKAAAGIEAVLRDVAALTVPLDDLQTGTLNALGVCALRTFPATGHVVWGARTLAGNDLLGSEFKYVPVRRLVDFVERSLEKGLGWAVFEPNDRPLWKAIVGAVEAFLDELWRQGALLGDKPSAAYFVRCDETTTTPSDIVRGVAVIQIGLAAQKPREFVLLRREQPAGRAP